MKSAFIGEIPNIYRVTFTTDLISVQLTVLIYVFCSFGIFIYALFRINLDRGPPLDCWQRSW